jgi:50S ribosomal protein L16 3-hydroxylase
MIDASFRALARHRPTRSDAEAALLRALSEPKPGVVFDPPARHLSPRAFRAQATKLGVALDRRTRLLYSGRRAAINGELLDVQPSASLRRFADHRLYTGHETRQFVASQGRLLHDWYLAGWLHLLRAQPSPRCRSR